MYAIIAAFSRAKTSVAYKYIQAVSICAFSRLRKRALKKKSLKNDFFAAIFSAHSVRMRPGTGCIIDIYG